MKIIKYLFLLLLLAAFAMSVFFATQKGDFEVTRTIVINSSRTTLYNYVNDYKNWEYFYNPTFKSMKNDFIFPKKTSGKSSSFSWKNEDDFGNFTTLTTIENQLITQKKSFNNSQSQVYWTFKDTLGKTKITFKNKGVMPFGLKIYTLLNGGPDKVLGEVFEKNLATIDKSLHQEISNYTIEISGQVTKLGNYYAYYPITSTISNITKNVRIITPKIEAFLKKNNLEPKGKPYIMINKLDVVNNLSNIYVCINLHKEFNTGPESEILTAKSEPFQAIKATLTGDYSHLDETYSKIEEYMLEKNCKQDFAQPYIEHYTKSLADEKKSSLWKTNIYIPIYIPKVKVKTTYTPKIKKNRVIINSVSDSKPDEPSVIEVEKEIIIPDFKRPQ